MYLVSTSPLAPSVSLLLQSSHMEMAGESDGAGVSEGETLAEEMAEGVLAEDQGEVHDFEGNNI